MTPWLMAGILLMVSHIQKKSSTSYLTNSARRADAPRDVETIRKDANVSKLKNFAQTTVSAVIARTDNVMGVFQGVIMPYQLLDIE